MVRCEPGLTLQPRCRGLLLLGLCVSLAHADGDVLEMPLESLVQLPVSVDSPFQETVIDAAASVAVLHPDDWQKRAASNLNQALEAVPGVTSNYTLGGAQGVAVRGYATELSARGIASVLDGVPIDNYSYATSTYDQPYFPLSLFGSVEMVRGPGSTLYGSDAFHGVIDMHTWGSDGGASPQQISASLGTQQQDALSWLGSTSEEGAWRAHAGFALNHQGDYALRYNYTDVATGAEEQGRRDEDLRNGSAFLHLETGHADSSLWRFSFYGDDLQDRGFPGIGTQFFQPLQGAVQAQSLNFSGAHDIMGQNSDFWLAQAVNERQLGHGLELETRLFQWRGEQTWMLDQSDLPLPLTTSSGFTLPCRTSVDEAVASPLFCPHTVYQGTSDERSGLHLLLKADNDDSWRTRWALGIGRDWLKVLDASIIREPLDGGPAYLNEEAPFDGVARHIDYALFQARTELWPERLSAVYGARMDDYSDVGQSTSPRAGLVYTPQPNWALKLLYSHAFRAPSAAEQYGSGPGSLQEANPDIRPETLATSELVLQHQGERQNTEVVLFRNHWANAIELNPVGTGGEDQYQNTGNDHAHGVELTQRLALGAWSVEGNASYIISSNANTGQAYSAFPSYIVNIGLGRQLTQAWSFWVNERAMIDLTETDAIGDTQPLDAPNYYRLDLHLEQQAARYRLRLDLRNVLDRHNIQPAVFNAEGGLPDEPRSLLVSVDMPY